MSEALRASRGTHDVLPAEAERRAVVEGVVAEVLGGAGYRRIETPVFESTELFHRGVGGSTDIVQKETYTFGDRGERSLTLRPEGTAGVCRAYLEHGMHKLPQPVRLWYSGPFFRYERSQKGRQRQFSQFGAEAIGSDDPALDVEGILLLREIVAATRAASPWLRERFPPGTETADLRLRLGSLGSIPGRAAYRELLVSYLREHEDRLADEVRERIDLNPLRAFDSDDPSTREVMGGAPLLLDHLEPEDAEHFAEVRALLDDAGVPYEVDPTLVRGLDYYSRTLFELTSDALGAQSGVGGGGRYDGLIEQLGGPATPAFGWATGIERLLLANGEDEPGREPEPDVYVAWHEGSRRQAVALWRLAREAGFSATLDLAGRGRKGQLRRAERSGARIVAEVRSPEDPVSLWFRAAGERWDEGPPEAAARQIAAWLGDDAAHAGGGAGPGSAGHEDTTKEQA